MALVVCLLAFAVVVLIVLVEGFWSRCRVVGGGRSRGGVFCMKWVRARCVRKGVA